MIFLSILSIVLDFLIIYFGNSYFGNISYFYPMLTLTFLVFLFNQRDTKKYFQFAFWLGFIYDVLFSYIFLFHALVFLLFAKIVKKVDKYIKCNLVVSMVLLIGFIFFYDFLLFFLVKLSNYNIVTFGDLIYKFKNSLVLNMIYFLMLWFGLKLVGKKQTKKNKTKLNFNKSYLKRKK